MSSIDRENGHRDSSDALAEHVAECSECAIEPAEIERVTTVLRSAKIDLDAALLSRRLVEMVAPEMARLAARAFRRRVAFGLLLALIPLPLVLAYDAFLLRVVHAVLSSLLPEPLVLYVVASMALSGLLVIATAYAAIPLLVYRQIAPRPTHA